MPFLACYARGQYMFPACLSDLSHSSDFASANIGSENAVNDQCAKHRGQESESQSKHKAVQMLLLFFF